MSFALKIESEHNFRSVPFVKHACVEQPSRPMQQKLCFAGHSRQQQICQRVGCNLICQQGISNAVAGQARWARDRMQTSQLEWEYSVRTTKQCKDCPQLCPCLYQGRLQAHLVPQCHQAAQPHMRPHMQHLCLCLYATTVFIYSNR